MRAAAGDVAPAVGAADLPDVTPKQGAALVALAQTAMTDYLRARIAPSSVKIPPQLRELGRRPDAVAVTLRRGGSVMAVEVHSDGDLCMNLIIAAMQAMRSPKLPDRVDDKVLAGLTVEVEVLGKPLPIDQDQVDQAVVPGLTGLQCGSGSSTVHVLPSAAYVLGLSPEQMLRGAMTRVGGADGQLPDVEWSGVAADGSPAGGHLSRSKERAAAAQPAVFTTRHYVGYPGSPAIELYRGKLSPAPPELDDKAALAAAASIGRYLAAHQEADGWFTIGDGEMPLFDQLYATWALGRLAARQPSPLLAECVKQALAAADKRIARSQGRAVVKADSPDDTLAATAFLVMALAAGPEKTQEAGTLRRELLAGLAQNLAEPLAESIAEPLAESLVEPLAASNVGPLAASMVEPPAASNVGPLAASLAEPPAASMVEPPAASNVGPLAASNVGPLAASNVGPLAASNVGPLAASMVEPTSQPKTATAPTNPPRQVYRGRYIALLALAAEASYAQATASARQILRRTRPANAEAALWAFRAGAAENWPPEFGEPNSPVGLTMQGPAGSVDNRGGFSIGAQPPQTDITGLAAVCMEQLLARQSGITPATAAALARQLAEARGFCAYMIYQPREAYFAADPNSWAGAVRATPGSAAATAPACAAAIEALIRG